MVLYMDASTGTAKLTGNPPKFTPVTLDNAVNNAGLLEKRYQHDVEYHNSILELITDSTLKKFMENMQPVKNLKAYVLRPVCHECDQKFPCSDYAFIAEDLKRRQATDPFINEGGVPSLSEGAL